MRYQFRFKNTAGNLLKMALYTTYTSFVGVINAVFMAAMGVLSIYSFRSFRGGAGIVWLIAGLVSVLAFLYFPMIQPVLIYRRMKKNLQKNTEETVMSFDEKQIYVKVGEKNESYSWEQIRSVGKFPWQLALYMNAQHGFVIPNEAMGEKKEEFYQFALGKVRKK